MIDSDFGRRVSKHFSYDLSRVCFWVEQGFYRFLILHWQSRSPYSTQVIVQVSQESDGRLFKSSSSAYSNVSAVLVIFKNVVTKVQDWYSVGKGYFCSLMSLQYG